MQRIAALFATLMTCLALAGCGDKTVTMQIGASGISMSMVVTGNSDAIDKAKQQAASSASGATVTVSDGDQHKGNKVCETDAKSQGNNYHVVVYSDSPLITASVCDSIKNSS